MQRRLRRILCMAGLSLCLLPGCSSKQIKETEVVSPNVQAQKTPEYTWVKDFSNAVINRDAKEIKLPKKISMIRFRNSVITSQIILSMWTTAGWINLN